MASKQRDLRTSEEKLKVKETIFFLLDEEEFILVGNEQLVASLDFLGN
jgi:hypothetical protein